MALVMRDVSEESSASIIRETRTDVLGTKKYVFVACFGLLVIADVVPSSTILVTMMMEALRSSEKLVLKDPYRIISQNTTFFIAVQFGVIPTFRRNI
jgi:hypothetical protein